LSATQVPSGAAAPLTRRIEVGELLPGEGSLAIAADLFMPSRLRSPPTALFCLPGGAMNRAYYDLQGEGDFSFAAHLAACGYIVVALDPLGVGGSSQPRDGFGLTPDVLVAAHARALEVICAELRSTRLTGTPLSQLRTVGVGHSMGAMLTTLQQAQYAQHAALMLLGFGTQGLPEALLPAERSFAGDPAGARANLVLLARTRSAEAYLEIASSAQSRQLFAGESADRRGVEALRRARAPLLVTAGLFSMIPGSCAPECARIDVPLLLAVGDRDIAGAPQQIPVSFPASPDITLLVLPETGHSHFLFSSRRQLFERVSGWLAALPAPG
jgi:pimeloyl-ACP methyl ester carboxylesterase